MVNSKLKKTINSFIEYSIDKFADRPALSFAFHDPMTYRELGEKINLVSAYLMKIGLGPDDKVSILAENSPNWGIAYLAIVRCGAIAVPILPDFPESDVHHVMAEANIKFLFTTQRQIEKIYELSGHKFERIISLDDSGSEHVDDLLKFSDLLEEAKNFPESNFDKVKEVEVAEDDLAAMIYTSGTSGHSKAVMLTHKNLCSNVLSTETLINTTPDYTFLSILPTSHTYEFTVGFMMPLLNGARIVYAGKRPTPTILERICKTERPSVMCIVPMVMEKIYKKRVMGAINSNFMLKYAVKFAWLRPKIMQKIGAKLLDFFGGELQVLAIGGAPLNIDTEKFLKEADFPYLVGYGLTETAPLLAGGPLNDSTIAVGSVGKIVPSVEVKIVTPDPQSGIGEIHARGPNIMKGYYNNKEATKNIIDEDNWLATGDLGFFDEKDNLHIKGRSKSVIVLAHGENIYPETIEEKINCFVQVAESLVVDNNGRLEARIYLDYDLVDKETGGSQEEQLKYIKQVLDEIKNSVNDQLPTYAKLQAVIERTEPFIKTATHKIKRYLHN